VNRTLVVGSNNISNIFLLIIRNNQKTKNLGYIKTVYNPIVAKQDGINVLGLLLFCILFGIIISRLKEKALILKQFFEAMLEVVMQLVRIAMLYSPIGIFFLIVAKMLEMDSLQDFVGSLGLYMVTVLAGLFIHGFIILPLLLFVITRINSFKYIRGMSQALVTAFGTASSSATLPVTYRCVEEKNHIDPRVSRFVLPVGATVNMDGTALYEAVAAIYIAQLNNIPLNAVKIIVTR
jgi:Na+/H+-dicarboxylate symporter